MGRKNFKHRGKIAFLKKNLGITLSELVIVVSILSIFMILAISSFKPTTQMAKAKDGKRKEDLKRIAIALEDYAGDKSCYPPAIYQGSEGCVAAPVFDHYLKNIPCDPQTGAHYIYERPDGCKKFIIYATLEYEKKNVYAHGNYYVSSPNLSLVPTVSPGASGATATPADTLPGQAYFGCFDGHCQMINDPSQCQRASFINLSDCTGDQCCQVALGAGSACDNPANSCN